MGPDSSASDEIRRFEEQSRRQPDSLVFARLADAYRKAGQPERALVVLQEGLARHPDYPSGHIVMARTLRDLGRVEETLHSFRRVLELDGGNLVAIMELAGLADERGDADEARHWHERLVQIDPTNHESTRRLGELESASAQPAGAIPDGADGNAWWNDSVVNVDGGEDGSIWWDDSAASADETPGTEAVGELGARDGETDTDPGPDEASDRRPEDEAVEAILNGDVPELVKTKDAWWYEDAPQQGEPEPSRDADLLTRTMADLYAEQGLDREATAIYKELLRDSPDDPELVQRIDALREKGRMSSEASTEAGEGQGAEAEAERTVPGEGEPIPLGRPAGPRVADELRRLLRLGEEVAGSLPDPEVRGQGPAGEAPPESGTDDGSEAEDEFRIEAPVDPPADSPTDTPAGQAEAQGLSDFADDWIRHLGTDA